MKVLVVDDSKARRRALAEVFSAAGCEVHVRLGKGLTGGWPGERRCPPFEAYDALIVHKDDASFCTVDELAAAERFFFTGGTPPKGEGWLQRPITRSLSPEEVQEFISWLEADRRSQLPTILGGRTPDRDLFSALALLAQAHCAGHDGGASPELKAAISAAELAARYRGLQASLDYVHRLQRDELAPPELLRRVIDELTPLLAHSERARA